MTVHQRSWALSRDPFERLLLVLDPDRERAGEKYQEIRVKLIRIFEWRGCGCPETLADQTIDRVSRRIAENERIRASDPAVYFLGVARNVLREYWKLRRKEWLARRFESFLVSVSREESDLEEREFSERLRCLDLCLAKLPRKSLELITVYYRSEKSAKITDRARLARELGITPGSLRIRIHRIRKQLETWVNESLKTRADG